MRPTSSIHFEISERKILLLFFDIIFVLSFLFLLGELLNFNYFSLSSNNYYWTLILGLYLTVVGTIFDMYTLQVANNRFRITKSIVLTTSVTTVLYLLTPYFTPVLPNNRLQIVIFYLAILFALFAWRNLYIVFFTSDRFIKRVVFVGNSKSVSVVIQELKSENPHYQVAGFVATDDKIVPTMIRQIESEELFSFVKNESVTEIVVVTHDVNKSKKDYLYDVLLQLLERGVTISQYSDLYESETYRLPIYFEDKDVYRFFPFSRNNQNKFYVVSNRFFDICFSIVGLFFFVLILPVVFLLNKFGNKGPLFYRQERIGRNGEPFEILKLRTMKLNAEMNGAVFAQKNDTRITSIGKFLRKTRLDEFPQFINVLKGEMAIIGPRPERAVFVDQIAKDIPLYQTRHVIKPGLTGWAQVNYPYGVNLEDSLMKLRYDLYYIKHRSLYLDINIVIKTLNTVLFFKGQ